MPDFCTCGAQLPPDARFCHKCGKPQREEPILEEEQEPQLIEVTPPPITPPPIPEQVPSSVTLQNRYAVRSALLAGVAAFLLSAPLGAFGLLVLLGGGAFAVFLYRKSTGQPITVAAGLRLGWITGIFLFVLLLLTFTASYALQPTFMADLESQIINRSTLPAAEVQQIISLLRTPIGIAAMVLGMFLSSTLPPAIGGAVGAKLLGRN